MSKSFKIGSIIFSLILVVLIVNMSFAWYSAKVNQGEIIELVSESIEINLIDYKNELKPGVLKEGVLTVDSEGKWIEPEEYLVEYFESPPTTVSFTNQVIITYDQKDIPNELQLEYVVKYIGKDGKVVEIAASEYFNITSTLKSLDEEEVKLNELNLSETNSSANYVLEIEISYKLPDELLPIELVNTSHLVIIIKGSLV